MTDARLSAPTLADAMADIDTLFHAEDARELDGTRESVATDFGYYDGLPPRIVLLPDGRNATLIDPIAYHRPDGSHWPVPSGAALDGASIPRAFWTLIGGPFEGKYRDASIVHDNYCVTQDRTWVDTHRMFYDAMRCSGVGRRKAGVMFYAVYRFGPRWPDPSGGTVEAVLATADPSDDNAGTLAADARLIVDEDLGPDAIATLAERRARSDRG